MRSRARPSSICSWPGPDGFLTRGNSWVPENSTQFGTDNDGGPLYIARSFDLPGLQLGKAKPDAFAGKGASIPFGGQEYFSTNYQVLAAPGGYTWVTGSGGSIPDGAVALGYDEDGSPLFAARVSSNYMPGDWEYHLEGYYQIGKIRHGFQGAYVSWGGSENSYSDYDVLCAAGGLMVTL